MNAVSTKESNRGNTGQGKRTLKVVNNPVNNSHIQKQIQIQIQTLIIYGHIIQKELGQIQKRKH